jgi:transcription elongation GreA/GreB family factor
MITVLPHEKRFLESHLDELSKQRLVLADAKAEAQGDSYDWHDNAPLDVIEREMSANMRVMQDIESMLRNLSIQEYPLPTETEVKLVTLVLAKDNFGPTPFILIGQSVVGKDEYEQAWEKHPVEEYGDEMLFVVTTSSPLGAAAIGLSVGGEATYQTERGPNTIQVASLDQTWMVNNFGTIE